MSDLSTTTLELIVFTGYCYGDEARRMAEEILRRREEEKKSQPGPEGFPELP